ncbi:hypothetical protein TSUD_253060 [Trifolium subterraneum]|nr:hypothetical protein TSUD_253060 [Trifolium subterraneum]
MTLLLLILNLIGASMLLTLVSELNALENKLAATYSTDPLHFNKSTSRQCAVCDYDNYKVLVVGKRFTCDDLYLSDNDDFDAEPTFRVQHYLINKVSEELDRKFDQYQRRIAEVLDNHLTVVQLDRELVSQIEERKVRNDVVYEERKREKKKQEKAKVEVEAKLQAKEVNELH